ncbi:MAG TPA: four helix bundle protein [Chitinophagaceae bacterium]|nr:four helix bundle protein [Chitinophagaceae bacterium]
MATYDHFYDLPVYKKCRSFRKNVSQIVKSNFPKSEEYHLKSQVLDSSRSITANIAEGFGRFHYQKNIQFCRQARGSMTETIDHMITAFDEEYIKEEKLKTLNEEYKTCLKELNIYIKYLKSAKEIINNI